MSDFFLTNRELALIVALLFWSVVVALLSRRDASGGGVGGSVRRLVSAIADKAILLPVVVYLCWMSAAFAAAGAVGLWDVRLVKAAEAQRLADNAGAVGTDSFGRQLDQREHAETMQALQWLYTCQLGYYPNQGKRYFADLEAIIDGLSDRYDLPYPNNIEMRISDDGQSWYAARQTITGHWFAIGAAGPPTDQWFYDGPTAPTCFPNESGWDQWVPDSNSPHWAQTPKAQLRGTTEVHATGHLSTSDTRTWRRFRTAFRHLMTRTKTEESDRPTWCRHYDEWKRAYDEAEAFMARNSGRAEDWSREDLARLEELTRTYGEAAGRMWGEAPESENWTSAHIKCS